MHSSLRLGGEARDVPSSTLLSQPFQHAGNVYFWSLEFGRCLFVVEVWASLCRSGNQSPSKERELVNKFCVSPGTARQLEQGPPVPLARGSRSHIVNTTAGRTPETTLPVFLRGGARVPESGPGFTVVAASLGTSAVLSPHCCPVSGPRWPLPCSWRFLDMGRGISSLSPEFCLRD